MNAILIAGIWGLIMMYSGIFSKPNTSLRPLAVVGIVLLLLGNIAEMYGYELLHINTHQMLFINRYGLLFNTVVYTSTLLYLLLTGKDIEQVGSNRAEYFALIFFVLAGVAMVTGYNTLLIFFLGIEIISIPLYILTGSDKRNLKSNEASLKYFLMGSFSTGLMLMGIALIYGARGSFSMENVGVVAVKGFEPFMMAGMLLLFISILFKVSAAPFHFWTPDVYDGAPTVFTSFMATVVKVAIFAAFLRLFNMAFVQLSDQWRLTIAVVIVLTLFIGNITAVFQQSVKRMLAYSSIAQAGFMLFAIFSYNDYAQEGLLLYAAAYCLATIGIFSILSKMKDYTFDGFNGLAKQHPWLAASNTIFLLSLAGIPLTAGFFAKYYMLASAVKSGSYLWLVIFAVLMAAVSVYYYFRVIQSMYFKSAPDSETPALEVTPAYTILLAILAGLVILLGVYPQALLGHLYF
jgi:NADH-quinone oxidoreductase subunit N